MRVFFFCLMGFWILTGCQTVPSDSTWQRFEYVNPEMGVKFHLKFYAPNQATAERVARLAYDRVEELDSIFSDYSPSSELNRLCAKPNGKPVLVSSDLFDIIQQSQRLSRGTGGAFDITAGPSVRLWRQSRKRTQMPATDSLVAATKRVGFQKIKFDSRDLTVTLLSAGMQLDLGGIAKGYAVDEAMRVLKQNGIRRAFVAASGDMLTSDPPVGSEGWRVEIRAVDEFGNIYPRTTLLKHQALSTSGDTEQFVVINGRRYSHIVDPRTGIGLTNRIAVTVVAASATVADSRATAISVLGAKKGMDYANSNNLQVLILTMGNKKHRLLKSSHWMLW
ncbi:MAG: FAD:protein FMN transferase [Verrucomicrobiota bacterium]|jgi:thiamine biosynthesis lipoprotein|nr:FAD:protein FMN transferase [Verrucomicrobiota bacterium]